MEKSENYFHVIREASRRLAFITFQLSQGGGSGFGFSSVMLQYFNIFSICLIDSFNLWEFLSSGTFESRPQISLRDGRLSTVVGPHNIFIFFFLIFFVFGS